MKQCKVPEDWQRGLIVPYIEKERICTRPMEVQRNNYFESYYIMKLLERILDKRLGERVEQELGEEQLGFRKGRGPLMGYSR